MQRTLLVALIVVTPTLALASGSELAELAKTTKRAVVALDHRPSGALGGLNPIDAGARACGFLIDKGYIVTSAQPLLGRRRMDVRLFGGVRARADVIGIDPLNGIGLLRLQAPEAIAGRMGGTLPTLEFGRSISLRAGQSVFTLGNAFDSLILDGTPSFSFGVVTAIARVREGPYQGMAIETDAAVNPGSFGGPLLNSKGQVIGVVTPTFSARRWLGQAVPGDQVRLAVEALLAGKPPTHGQLGLRLRSNGGEASKTGVEVVEVQDGSGAATAGVRTGDRLLAIDGVPVYDTADVAREIERLAPGCPLRLQLGDRAVTCVLGRGRPVDLAARPQAPTPTQPRAATQLPPKAKAPRLGLRLEERENARPGLKITEVSPDGAGARAGIKVGDLLMMVQRTRLRSLDDMRRALGDLRGSHMLLVLLRERKLITLRIPLEPTTAERPPATPEHPPAAKEPGFLGVFLDPNNTERGAHVDGTQPGSPAERAGLLPGDVVLGANGRPIPDTKALITLLGQLGAGDKVSFLVLRDGAQKKLEATLARRGAAPEPAPAPAPQAQPGWLGVALDPQGGKLVVVEVDPRGPIAKAGIRPGDAVLSIDGQRVSSLDGLAQLLSGKRAGDTVRLDVERNAWSREFDITLAKRP